MALWSPPAAADGPYNSELGIAIKGYDSVAYFREGRAVRGSMRHRYYWSGALWLFLTSDNQAAFMVEPERFAPRYGGFSAYGISEGRVYGIDPNAYLIVDDKLYLHANHYVMRRWQDDLDANIARADAHWRLLTADWDER